MSLSELASRCTLFQASPSVVGFLCSIPNSPISLTSDNLSATLSWGSLACARQVKDFINWSARKRKRVPFSLINENEERGQPKMPLSKRIRIDWTKMAHHLTGNIIKGMNAQPSNLLSPLMLNDSLYVGSITRQLPQPSVETNATDQDVVASRVQDTCKFSLVQDTCKSPGNKEVVNKPQQKQLSKIDKMSTKITQKSRQNPKNIQSKETKRVLNSISSKDSARQSVFPNFEAYTVEEEEGSGGYGTVYRARRKSDGNTVAIKCPHANAHKHHVTNELRMLERFGGKSFVIKYEGCFKSGNSDCFVLEHVEHDRPEVLKKEIDVFQLQWYGYCMFRALASLHKQGTVHRDVKPGNFLFSRKTGKGYLIDFNLAVDLHQKYRITYKSKLGFGLGSDHTHNNAKSMVPTSSKKFTTSKSINVNHDGNKGSASNLTLKNLKKRATGETRVHTDLSRWNKFNSQGADGSGVTSAKDVTSTKTPSAERLREPFPCQGRKELINLLQEVMTTQDREVFHVSAPMRKRIAASCEKMDKDFLYITPMPLHSSSLAVAGAGFIKGKGDGKSKKEGPCAGTKGFRAPEVCLRSSYQGPKIDIWSAGVTLLYLINGRTPFVGDPEQNLKDIAKLRGSEDLWEVAKLHNRESLFPVELYDTQFLPSMDLKQWCQINTKRRDILETIPRSFFDLLDKCLTVNPRLRISAEDALKHDFFTPLRESLRRKQRLVRQSHRSDSRNSHPLLEETVARPSKSLIS